MTHPSPHPGTPTPPPGPSRSMWPNLAAFLDLDGRRARSAAAATAGSYGQSASPLTQEQREDNYRLQNGTWTSGRLTPRQRRRVQKKLSHSVGL